MLKNLPVIKAYTMPNNEKQRDWLLQQTELSDEDCQLVDGILGHYEKTWMMSFDQYPDKGSWEPAGREIPKK